MTTLCSGITITVFLVLQLVRINRISDNPAFFMEHNIPPKILTYFVLTSIFLVLFSSFLVICIFKIPSLK